MKTRILLIIISSAMIFCSCKKDDTDSTGAGPIGPKIEIFPGVGAAKMQLGDTYSELKQIYGNPDSRTDYQFPTGVAFHRLTYDSIKAVFEFFNYSLNLYDDDNIEIIQVEYPYDGLTDKLIGIGSLLNDVVVAYGEPPEIITANANYYRYELLGIDFHYNESDALVIEIHVYYPE